MFELVSKFDPSGDQPEAIKSIVDGIKSTFDIQKYTTILIDISWL